MIVVGRTPGRTTTTSVSRGAIPARATDDLPLPDAPTTATKRSRAEQLQAPLDDLLPPEEQVGVVAAERRQARVRAARRIGWCADTLGHDRGDLVGAVQSPQHVGTERDQLDAGRQRQSRHVGRRRRQQDLAGPGELADPCRPVHRRAEHVAVDRRPALPVARPARTRSAPDRRSALRCSAIAACTAFSAFGEHGHRGVAFDRRAEPPATVCLDVAIDGELHLGEQRRHPLRRLLPQRSSTRRRR